MGQTGSKPTAQGQVESSINDTINFIMAKVAAGEIDAATATELIAAARKDYESNVPVSASAQQAVQPQQPANTYQANPQTAYAVPETEPEQTPVDYRKFFNPSSQLNVNAANDAAVFNEILNEKMRQGVSNIRRKMYITFSVSAATVDDAVPKLTRIENQISQILTSIGSKSRVLDGAERLALLNSQLNPLKPFNFDYRRDISARMVQTTKDCIAPTTLDFKPEGLADCFKTGDMWGQVLVIKKLGSELTDQALSDITELPIPLNVTWFAQPMDKAAAVAFTRQRLAWIDKEIIEEQRSAVQKGYDFSILPQELKYSKEETEDVIDNLQNKNQRLYVFTGLFYTYAPTKKQLDNQVLSIRRVPSPRWIGPLISSRAAARVHIRGRAAHRAAKGCAHRFQLRFPAFPSFLSFLKFIALLLLLIRRVIKISSASAVGTGSSGKEYFATPPPDVIVFSTSMRPNASSSFRYR